MKQKQPNHVLKTIPIDKFSCLFILTIAISCNLNYREKNKDFLKENRDFGII